MKVKTADLIDAALDWAVAQCEGFKKIYAMAAWSNKRGAHGGPQVMVGNKEDSSFDYRPSSDWSEGGPIIERENIDLISPTPSDPLWQAMQWRFAHGAKGPTPLIAAMRCFVASRFGDEVDIPEELLT